MIAFVYRRTKGLPHQLRVWPQTYQLIRKGQRIPRHQGWNTRRYGELGHSRTYLIFQLLQNTCGRPEV